MKPFLESTLGRLLCWTRMDALIRRRQRRLVPILMYHSVAADGDEETCMSLAGMTVTESRFRQHMRYVARNYRAITMADYVRARRGEAELPDNACVITFDDGLLDFHDRAAPILREFKLTAVAYVMGGSFAETHRSWLHDLYAALDRNPHERCCAALEQTLPSLSEQAPADKPALRFLVRRHFAELNRAEREEQLAAFLDRLPANGERGMALLSVEQIRELSEQGFEIGAHTLRHEYLSHLTLEQLDDEIRENRALFEALDAAAPDPNFCYPFGGPNSFDDRVVSALKRAGFASATSTIEGLNNGTTDLFALKRIQVVNNMNLPMFCFRILGLGTSMKRWEASVSRLSARFGPRSLLGKVRSRLKTGFQTRLN